MVLEQWREMKEEIRKEPGLNLRNFHDLWPHMLVHYTDEYNLVLRLVAIALLVPTDTSECERVFSLMNDLKTAERSLLKQETLKNLMLWHSLATKVVDGKRTHLDCMEVPVISRCGHAQRVPRDGGHQGAQHPPWHDASQVRVHGQGRGGQGLTEGC